MSLLPSEMAGEFQPIDVEASVEAQGPCGKKLKLTIPAATITQIYDHVTGELSGQVRLPGFRPGKVPRGYVVKMFKDQIEQRVMADALGRAFQTTIDKEKLDVVGEPKMDLENLKVERDKELQVEIEVETKPEIELGNYKGLPVEQEEVEVFPEEVQKELEAIATRHGEPVDAPEDASVGSGDAVQGVCRYLDGEQELKKNDEHYVMMGEGKVYGLHADVDESFLMGAKIGEQRSIDECEIDDQIEEESLRGKKLKLEFEVKRIRRAKTPEIDDELAKRVGLNDLAALKQRIEEHIREQLAEATNAKTRKELVERVSAATPFELPDRLLESYQASATNRQREWFARMGLTEEHLAEREEELKETASKSAEKELRTFFILESIAKKEGLEPTDDDVDDEILSMARQQNMRAGDLFDQMKESGQLQELKLELRTRKATEFLVDNAEIKVVPRKRPDDDKKEEEPDKKDEAKAEGQPKSEEKSSAEEKPAAEDKPNAEEETPAKKD